MDITHDEDTRSDLTPIESTKLVIIGGGIAGLGAALRLEQSYFKDYILLEAQSQLGGRIKSVQWGNGWLEEGAQFLHGTDSRLGNLLQDSGLLDKEVLEGQGIFVRQDGSFIPRPFVNEINMYIKRILEKCETYVYHINPIHIDDNLGKKLRFEFGKNLMTENEPQILKMFKAEIFDWNIRFLAIDNACTSLDELSLEKWGEYIPVNGPENYTFKTHYGSIVEKIVKNLTQENIRLDCPVTNIKWNQEETSKKKKPIIVTLNNGSKIKADCVIVTCSLGYLKEKHNKLFSPQLPMYYTHVIENMGFGVINKVFLEFDQPWWDSTTEGYQLLWIDGTDEKHFKRSSRYNRSLAPWTRDLTGFDVVKNHPNILVGWVGRNGAKIIECLEEKQIIIDCANLLRYFLKRDDLPEADRCLRTRWGNNEFIKGAYCHLSKSCEASGGPQILSEPICRKIPFNDGNTLRVPILMLAGEATSPNYYSTTHGAYDTGVKQAEFFLNAQFDENSN